MSVIGLTGGIAAGKSTAAELLREFGAVVIDADRLGHRSYEPGTPGFEKVVNHFGHDVVGKDGNIDRRILGGKVFGAPGELQRLNELIWPEIRTLIREEIAQIRTADKNAFIVLEAAVLIEAGWQDLCDEIWVVYTSTKGAVDRLRTRNGLTEEAAMARIDSQMSTKDRLSYAQVKIENSGTEAQLRQRMEKAWKSLIDRTPAAKRPAGLKPAPRAAAAAKAPAKPAAKAPAAKPAVKAPVAKPAAKAPAAKSAAKAPAAKPASKAPAAKPAVKAPAAKAAAAKPAPKVAAKAAPKPAARAAAKPAAKVTPKAAARPAAKATAKPAARAAAKPAAKAASRSVAKATTAKAAPKAAAKPAARGTVKATTKASAPKAATTKTAATRAAATKARPAAKAAAKPAARAGASRK
ncbi:MAG: dephospho-CoA kinase [Dehalococcoidia bacterium]|nr:dephospho-CoA kinase [Dehalococcoidia bacterium]